jgi:hypothetical protein
VPVFAGVIGVTKSILLNLPPYALTLPWIKTFGLIFPILTSIFITSVSVVVAYVCVRAYLRERPLSVLFLGCGTLVFGCTSLLTSMFLGAEGVNFSVTVFAMGALLSAAFHFACAFLTLPRGTPRLGKRYHVVLWISAAILSVVLIVVAALEGVLPSFFDVGKGSTALCQVVLGVAAVIFASSSALVFSVSLSSKSHVLRWYSRASGATAAGIFGVILSGGNFQAVEMRLGWVALYIGGFLLLTSVISAERLSDLPQRTGDSLESRTGESAGA